MARIWNAGHLARENSRLVREVRGELTDRGVVHFVRRAGLDRTAVLNDADPAAEGQGFLPINGL